MIGKRVDLEDRHGQTVVARIEIRMNRAGECRVEGSITDKAFAHFMLDTARDVVNGYHDRGGTIIVPAYDTALVGTPEEKLLLAERDKLDDAIRGR